MALTRGTRLGAYEILELIGAGGMGEVYRARDPGLGRDVAIKVMPAAVGGDPDRVQRFEQEARAIGALNHPNILTVHATGVHDGTAFVVSELLDGDTLEARLRGGPMAPRKAVEIAIAIAHGLAAAHAKGIVHRDLKPANVFLPKVGPVKILDFGLAKLIQMPADETMAMDPGAPATLPGMVMGTAGYMAPEQVRGQAVDHRSDVFSFGVVLYEMIAGRRAFAKPTLAETMTAILNEDPPSIVRADAPPALLKILHRCLEKRAEDRFHSTDDLAFALDATTGQSGSAPAHTLDGGESLAGPAAASIDRRVLVAAALVIGAVLGGAAIGWYRRPAASVAPSAIGRFAIELPARTALSPTDNQTAGAAVALSPDGSKLVYVVTTGDRQQLMLRTLDQLEPVTLRGTEGASGPFFSPDGEWVAFFSDNRLKKLAVSGGVPLRVADVPPVARGGTWSEDGTIFFTPTFSDPIYKVPASGGEVAPVTSLLEGESNHLLPQMLPGSKAFVFTAWKGGAFADASVWVWMIATGERRKLLDAASHARYEGTGHLVFSRGNALLAVSFDLTRLAVSGEPLPVVEGVLTNPANGTAEFALSQSGTLAYASAPATPPASKVVWVDRGGHEEAIADIPGLLERPRLSPDGRRIAVENLNDLWVFELATGVFRRVTFQGVNQYPVWSPDGSRLTFSRGNAGRTGLFWTPSEGNGQPEAMLSDATVQFPNDWAPDGSILAFAQVAGVQASNWDILAWAPNRKPVALVDGGFNQFAPVFSPDGRWLAYLSDESGRREVYVRPYPGRGAATQITSMGADQPRWGRDGAELFFYHGDEFMRAQVKTAPAFSASRPAVVFVSRFSHRYDEPGYPSYDVSADGRRFLMIKAGSPDSALSRLTVVLNWTEELRRRAPQRR